MNKVTLRTLALSTVLCVICAPHVLAADGTGSQVYHWGAGQVHVEPAADVAPDAGCGVAGLVQAQGTGNQTSYPNAPAGADTTQTRVSASATAAANLNCGNWNYQGVISAGNNFPYLYSYGNRGYTSTNLNGSGAFNVFWRDPSSFMVGLGVGRYMANQHDSGFGTLSGKNYDQTFNDWNGTAFAELYPNEQFTLGVTGFYETGDAYSGFKNADDQLQVFGGSAYARYYATQNLRFSVRGTASQTNDTTANVTSSNINAVVSADYKFDNSPLALFGGLRYGSNNSNNGSVFEPNTYVQGFAGVQIALGPHSNGSLLEQDRNGVALH